MLPLLRFTQVCILYQRAINANRRDTFLVYARALQTVFLALVYGSLMFRYDLVSVTMDYCMIFKAIVVGR